MSQRQIILIGGPTASGKSAFAMQIARARDGCIINADAMQIYAGLPLLTAQPDPQDKAEIPHFLYEVTDAATAGSVGKWLDLAQAAIAEVQAMGRVPILVGGTGMYFQALLGGLTEIPDIPDDVRVEVEALYASWGEEKFRAALAARDALSAVRIERNDRQRLVRAYEVVAHTGKSLGKWHAGGSQHLRERHTGEGRYPESAPDQVRGGLARQTTLGQQTLAAGSRVGARDDGSEEVVYEKHLLMPPREDLYAACDKRFLSMMECGAVDEVKALMQRDLAAALPAMKILGVREIAAYVRGETDLKTAVEKAQQATRNYAKRQMTWFRNQW